MYRTVIFSIRPNTTTSV